MGYQESFRPISHLAEAAGIKRAIDDYKDNPHIPDYCVYYCATRSKSTGELYACIGGQRCRVHIVAGIDIDDCFPYDEKYSDYYEDLNEPLVEEAARERPDLVEQAYQAVAAAFERAAERGREWERELREEAIAQWPTVAKLFRKHGPMPLSFFERHPLFAGHFMHNVMVDLEKQGLVKCEGHFYADDLWLTDKALGMLGIDGPPPRKSDEEWLITLLDENGEMSSRNLSNQSGMSVARVRSELRKLINRGCVVPMGNGRARKYRLAEKDSALVG
ncbi:MAG: winged helix-turn-helix domain-containing protein [Atopobiaceae bacterium]|nr:winged helix-turn-helix domain-containing protein [Atopobiaceae bacterium]